MIDIASTVVLACCAVVITGYVILTGGHERPADTFSRIDDWRGLLAEGRIVAGRSPGTDTIIEFADFECPFCRQAVPIVDSLARSDGLTVVYRHFPLEIHPHALAAAAAAECAGDQGRFAEYYERLFSRPLNESGFDWATVARDAAVPSLRRFRECVAGRRGGAAVARDVAAGHAVGVVATPTFIVNGYLVRGLPKPEVWTRLLNSR